MDARLETVPRPSPNFVSASKVMRFEETEGDNGALSLAGVLSALIVQVDAVETFLPCLAACKGTACSTNFLPVTSETILSFSSASQSLTEDTEVAGDECALPEVRNSPSESPLVLEVPRVLDDEARDKGRGREVLFPEARDKYVAESLFTRFCTPEVGATGAGTGMREAVAS